MKTVPKDHRWQDLVCPACSQPVVYVPGADRFFHEDGSANAGCWGSGQREADNGVFHPTDRGGSSGWFEKPGGAS